MNANALSVATLRNLGFKPQEISLLAKEMFTGITDDTDEEAVWLCPKCSHPNSEENCACKHCGKSRCH